MKLGYPVFDVGPKSFELFEPFSLPCNHVCFVGEGEADVLRIRAPKSYWLYLEGQTQEQVEILRRDLNGSNGLPPLGESFQARVRKSLK